MRSSRPAPLASVDATRGALAACALALGACARLGVPEQRIPAVAPATDAEAVTIAGRTFRRVEAPAFELYAQSSDVAALADARLRRAAQEFARHFGGAPRVAVLLFDPPADPAREFDFGPFVERGVQVLAFVRARDAKQGPLGVDESLFDARAAELLLASYADSVIAAQTGRRDGGPGLRSLDRLPHWFAEAVVSRVARPDAVEQGRRFSSLNQSLLLPLHRLFGLRRSSGVTWSELAPTLAGTVVVGDARQGREAAAPNAVIAAQSTAFGEFLVDRLGPTALPALADELLAGHTTEEVLGTVAGMGMDGVEGEWEAWLRR